AFAHPTGSATYRIIIVDFYSQIIYKSLQPCSSRGVFSRGEPERPSKAWRPRSGLRSHRGRTRPASLECDPKSSHCCLVQGTTKIKRRYIKKSPGWSAERRAFRSLEMPGSRLECSESPRAVMHATGGATRHPGACRRSARPSSGRRMKKKEEARSKK